MHSDHQDPSKQGDYLPREHEDENTSSDSSLEDEEDKKDEWLEDNRNFEKRNKQQDIRANSYLKEQYKVEPSDSDEIGKDFVPRSSLFASQQLDAILIENEQEAYQKSKSNEAVYMYRDTYHSESFYDPDMDFSQNSIEMQKFHVKKHFKHPKVPGSVRMKKLLKDFFPTFGFGIISFLEEVIILLFIGEHGSVTEFATVALGMFWVNSTGYVLVYGFTSSQRQITSAKEDDEAEQREVLRVFHHSLFITLILSGLAIVLNVFSEEILGLFGISPSLTHGAHHFTLFAALGLIPYSFTNCLKNYLAYRKLSAPSSYAAIGTFFVQPLVCCLLIVVLDMGIKGAGLAYLITRIIDLVIILGFILFGKDYRDAFKRNSTLPHKSVFQGFLSTLKTGLSSIIITAIEWWTLEYFTIIVAQCCLEVFAAYTVCTIFENIISHLAAAFGSVIQVQLAFLTAEYNKKEFHNISRLGPFLSLSMIALLVILITLLRRYLPVIFLSDSKATEYSSELMLFAMIYAILNATSLLFGSILKAVGRHQMVTWTKATIFIAIGAPLSILFGFVFRNNQGSKPQDDIVMGIWSGKAFALLTCLVIFGNILIRENVIRGMEQFRRTALAELEPLIGKGIFFEVNELVEAYLESKKKGFLNPVVRDFIYGRVDYRGRKIGR